MIFITYALILVLPFLMFLSSDLYRKILTLECEAKYTSSIIQISIEVSHSDISFVKSSPMQVMSEYYIIWFCLIQYLYPGHEDLARHWTFPIKKSSSSLGFAKFVSFKSHNFFNKILLRRFDFERLQYHASQLFHSLFHLEFD